MSRIAFYAPLKAPTHPVPSGDRELARGIMAALSRNSLGLTIDLVSELRTFDARGDLKLQQDLITDAEREVDRLLEAPESRLWQVWVTYHNYYKAPDLIGPKISRTLNIPYVIIEASIARKRLSGPWAEFAKRSDDACAQAELILFVTERDGIALTEHRHNHQRVEHFPPFLNRDALDEMSDSELKSLILTRSRNKVILAVGMLRPGDKYDSYRVIASVLTHLQTPDWRLIIAGDGPAKSAVASLFLPFGDRIEFRGQLGPDALSAAYQEATLLLWPGVNEAFGMVYLEAQASGLPVVAESRPGVRDVVAPGNIMVNKGDFTQMTRTVDDVLSDVEKQVNMALSGRRFIRGRHLLGPAADGLSEHLNSVLAK